MDGIETEHAIGLYFYSKDYNRGMAYELKHDKRHAHLCYQTALQIDPTNTKASPAKKGQDNPATSGNMRGCVSIDDIIVSGYREVAFLVTT